MGRARVFLELTLLPERKFRLDFLRVSLRRRICFSVLRFRVRLLTQTNYIKERISQPREALHQIFPAGLFPLEVFRPRERWDREEDPF